MAKKRKYTRDTSSHAEASRKSDVASSEISPQDPGMLSEETPFSLTCRNGLLVHEQPANYGLLDDPVDFDITEALAVSLQRSRRTWLTGCMFEKFWTRPQRGRKLAEGQYNARDKMAKLCECKAEIGPHVFELRLFTVKDEASPKDPVSALTQPAHGEDFIATKSHSNTASSAVRNDVFSVQTASIPITAGPNPSQAVAISSKTTERETDPPAATIESEQKSTPAGTGEPYETAAQPVTQRIERLPHDPATIHQPPSRSEPPQSSPKPPSKNPNEELIDRLHALARQDPQFGELMKSVASGKASVDEVRRFQVYIAQSRQVDRGLGSHSYPSTSVPYFQTSKDKAISHSGTSVKLKSDMKKKERELLRDQTLVFEFKENPTDRFLFPKESLVKLFPNGTVSATIFLLAEEAADAPAEVGTTPTPDKKERKKKKSEEPAEADIPPRPCDPKYYTPLNITFYGIPRKLQDVFIRAVHPRDEVMKYFRDTLTKLKRTKDWWVYYKVDATDAGSINKAVEPIGNNNPNLKKKPWSTNKDAVGNILVQLSEKMLINWNIGKY
ncbi:uncharacterized protein V1513DRAFT_436496 [Lipomyces chichibuensis]|uniref:uncharacterized protein n=1 Tax=Lipomyces chichibuensis TaxID=1546026 RepID=UPI0033436EE4